MAVAGNSVGGDMATELALMGKDRAGQKISLKVLFYPATYTDFNAELYQKYESAHFLTRASMQSGCDIYICSV